MVHEKIFEKNVLITIIPHLNDVQRTKIIEIIDQMESNGCKVFIFSDSNKMFFEKKYFTQIKPISLSDISFYNLFKFLFKMKTLVWIIRLKFWSETTYFNALKIFWSKLRQTYNILNSKIEIAFIWNSDCCEFGILNDVLKLNNIPTYCIEHGPLKNTISIDNGFMFNRNSLYVYSEKEDSYRVSGKQLFDQFKKNLGQNDLYLQDKPKIPAEFEALTNKVKILIMGLSEVDCGVYPSWYKKDRSFFFKFHKNGLHQAMEIAKLNDNYQVIFKPHPNHNPYSDDKKFSKNLFVVNGNAEKLYEWCDIVVANGSKTELDSIIYNKPVINISNGLMWYSNATYRIDSKDQIKNVIEDAFKSGLTKIQIESFIFYLGFIRAHVK
jgi:hypothetical protein